ncbi:MAG TPA: hypothetical protein ENJ95_18585 [Bacteroidetes bacterium]|nr:hypothetical protein [Bacteroidota bacterium]
MKKHPHLHDRFFKSIFKIREIALEHVEDYVPSSITSLLNLDTFNLDPTAFSDNWMKEHLADVIYGCQLNCPLDFQLALLHEHKSKQPESDIRFQILVYIGSRWEDDRKCNRPRTFVLPSVIYNGLKKWNKRLFRESFAGLPKALYPYLPEFDYLLLNLPAMTDKEIIKRSEGKILASSLLSLKHAREPDYFKKNFEKLFNFDWKRYSTSIWQTFLKLELYFISSVTGFTTDDFKRLAKPLPPELNHYTMLTMESILEEGIAIGRKEGKMEGLKEGKMEGLKEGKMEGLKEGMEKGMEKKALAVASFIIQNYPDFSDDKVAAVTGLTKRAIAKLRAELKKHKPNGKTNGRSEK